MEITLLGEFKRALQKIKKQQVNSLIIDLRNNGGGYLHDAQLIINEFLEKDKKIVYTKGRSIAANEEYYSDGRGIFKEGKVIILVNERSASASEIVSGALQDNDRALIVGRRTFGKGLVQRPFKLSDGSNLRLTISRYYTPVGRCIQKPYGEDVSYGDELPNRLKNGELYTRDSIKVIDSLKYQTPNGRVVYGGGGIVPDVFVSVDSAFYSDNYSKIVSARIAQKLALEILDQEEFKFKSAWSFAEHYKLSVGYQNQLKKSLAPYGFVKFKDIVTVDILKILARELYGMEGYYLVDNHYSKEFKEAVINLPNENEMLGKR